MSLGRRERKRDDAVRDAFVYREEKGRERDGCMDGWCEGHIQWAGQMESQLADNASGNGGGFP